MRDVETAEQHREFRPVEHDVVGACRYARHAEAPACESLVVEDEAAAIPEEHLDAIAPTADEDEEVPAERIEREQVSDQRAETIVAPSQVDRLGREKYLRTRSDGQHAARTAATSAATYRTSFSAETRRVTSRTDISMETGIVAIFDPSDTDTGSTRGRGFVLVSPRRFQRHHASVFAFTP